MIKKYIYIALAICLALICAAVGFAGYFIGKFRSGCEVDFTTKYDTITICNTDTLKLAPDTVVVSKIGYKYVSVHDTIRIDSIVYIPIEITQKWYHQDSLCDVWISGYEPNLDSLHLCQRHTTEIVRKKVIEREIPRFNVEADVRGIFVSDRLVGSIGAEVRYNKPKMTCSVGAAYTTDKKPVFSIGVGYRFDIK